MGNKNKMATYNLSVNEEAYRKLVRLKEGKDSFSDVIIRDIKEKSDKEKLKKYFGILSKESADRLEKNLKKIREARMKADEERIRRIKRNFI